MEFVRSFTKKEKLCLKIISKKRMLLTYTKNTDDVTLITSYLLCFLLGNSPASELYMPTFRNTLSVPSS